MGFCKLYDIICCCQDGFLVIYCCFSSPYVSPYVLQTGVELDHLEDTGVQ